MATVTEQFTFDYNYGRDTDHAAEGRRETAAVAAHLVALRARHPKDALAGVEIRFPMADGYARYAVISSRPLRLCHLAVGDAYHANPILLRGLNLGDVQGIVARERAWDEACARRQREREARG